MNEANERLWSWCEKIKEGKRLSREDDTEFLLKCDVTELQKAADELRKLFVGDEVDLCSIIAGKSGNCSEDCKFCAQSGHHATGCETYDLLPYERIYETGKSYEDAGVHRFAIVNSGYGPSQEEFEDLIKIYERLHKDLKISLCASLGFLTEEQFQRLHEAGVRSYHNNIETSRKCFPNICTTHSFLDKVENIKRAKAAGMRVCSGGIMGMGESMEDRVDMAFDLFELGADSIPINILLPIPNTPLEHNPTLGEEEILRIIGIFRFVNPEAEIRFAAGRKLLSDNGRGAFSGGASAIITGNMLTTTGSTIEKDKAMLKEMGRR